MHCNLQTELFFHIIRCASRFALCLDFRMIHSLSTGCI